MRISSKFSFKFLRRSNLSLLKLLGNIALWKVSFVSIIVGLWFQSRASGIYSKKGFFCFQIQKSHLKIPRGNSWLEMAWRGAATNGVMHRDLRVPGRIGSARSRPARGRGSRGGSRGRPVKTVQIIRKVSSVLYMYFLPNSFSVSKNPILLADLATYIERKDMQTKWFDSWRIFLPWAFRRCLISFVEKRIYRENCDYFSENFFCNLL